MHSFLKRSEQREQRHCRNSSPLSLFPPVKSSGSFVFGREDGLPIAFILMTVQPFFFASAISASFKLAGQAPGRRICAAPFPSQHRDDGLELLVHVYLRRSTLTKLAPTSQWCCSKAGGSSAIGPPSRR